MDNIGFLANMPRGHCPCLTFLFLAGPKNKKILFTFLKQAFLQFHKTQRLKEAFDCKFFKFFLRCRLVNILEGSWITLDGGQVLTEGSNLAPNMIILITTIDWTTSNVFIMMLIRLCYRGRFWVLFVVTSKQE